MGGSVRRFTNRVENYSKYRPGYPQDVISLLASDCGLTPDSSVADIGSGTGILSELFLRNGNEVLAVEPNEAMRSFAEKSLEHQAGFKSIAGSAEETTLPSQSVDIIVAGQAFHWFEQNRARIEFARILKPNGWVVLVWNVRRLTTSEFLRALEALLLKYGTDYQEVRHENVDPDLASFYEPATFRLATFENLQKLDLAGLQGRVLSASYTPEPDSPDYEPMVNDLAKLFSTHQVHGKVTIEYDTKVYYGQLNA